MNPSQETESFQFPTSGIVEIPAVAPAPYLLTSEDLKVVAPELPELVRLSELENRREKAAKEFSHNKAKEDFERESSDLRSDPSSANIARLKSLGSLEDRRAAYAVQYRGLKDEAKAIHKKAVPLIRKISERLDARLEQMSAKAVEEELALFEKWGLPCPSSIVEPHFRRARFDLKAHLSHYDRGLYFSTLSHWIKRHLAI